jgi:CheY-like chemotaxis protein
VPGRPGQQPAHPAGGGQRAVIQMTDMLSQHGYRVQVARHGREALEHIEQALPDAVILDLMMPGVDGFQVL